MECVVLLHGLARTSSSLSVLENELVKEGYFTVNIGYPSRKFAIEKLAEDVILKSLAKCPKNSKINFVTHSLGGILLRHYLKENNIEQLKHVVMLGPPNKGSEVVDILVNFPGFKTINGPAGTQLGTGELSVPNKLGPANFSLGVIAGTRSINLILSAMLPGKNDGKVSVESTKLEGMNDHIVLPVTHPFMMRNKSVIQQVIYYLKNGKFNNSMS